MPFPNEYRDASREFADFLGDVRDEAAFGSRHMAYTMVEGVFQVFRRRLSLVDAIRFAGVLPVGMRALFVSNWDTAEPRAPFSDLEAMNAEVKELRAAHNFSTSEAIQDVASALVKHVNVESLRTLLADISDEALAFWQLS